jgi:radical SAM protein with 4Fe4S-binding SPASM domain
MRIDRDDYLRKSNSHCNSTEISAEDEFYFQWHITEKCNQRCRHCYHDNYDSNDELSAEDLLVALHKILETTERWNKRATFSFTGGEPFIRKEEVLRLATFVDNDHRAEYYDILTNGSLINNNLIEDLSRLTKLRRVQLSMEGLEYVNDLIRGEGAFKRTISVIRDLKSAGIPVSVMTTANRLNKKDIFPLIELLDDINVDTFAVERFVPEGRGSQMLDNVLSSIEIQQLYTSLFNMRDRAKNTKILMYRPLFGLIDKNDPTIGAMCSVGTNALTIMHDGTVLPCRRLPIPIGHIFKDSLYSTWYSSPILWDIRNPINLKGKCKNCDLIPICRGCRAAAYASTGDYLAEDPQCWR